MKNKLLIFSIIFILFGALSCFDVFAEVESYSYIYNDDGRNYNGTVQFEFPITIDNSQFNFDAMKQSAGFDISFAIKFDDGSYWGFTRFSSTSYDVQTFYLESGGYIRGRVNNANIQKYNFNSSSQYVGGFGTVNYLGYQSRIMCFGFNPKYFSQFSRPTYNGEITSVFDFPWRDVSIFFFSHYNDLYRNQFLSAYGSYLIDYEQDTIDALFHYLHDYGGSQESFLNNIFVLNDYLNIDLYNPVESSPFFNGLWRMRYLLSDSVQNYAKYQTTKKEPIPTENPNIEPDVLNPDNTIVNPSVDDTEHILLLKEIIRLLVLDINNDYAYNTNLENFNNYTVTPFFNDVNNALNGLAGALGGMLNHLSLIDDLNLKLGDINTNLGDIISNTSGGSGGDTSIDISLDNISQSLVDLGTCNYDFTEFEEYIQTSINNHVKYQNLLTSDNNDVPVIEQMSLYGSVRGASEDGDLSSYDIAGYIPQYQNEDLTFNIPYISNVNLSNDASNYSLEFDTHTFVIQEDFPVFDSAIKKLRKFLGFILLCWFVVSLRNKLPAIIRGES